MVWNLIIKAQIDSGFSHSGLWFYKRMRELGVLHDGFTFPIVNRAVSASEGPRFYGELIHCVAIKMGFGSDVYFCNTIIEVYAKSRNVCHAFKMFDEMPLRDLVSWTSVISGCFREGCLEQGFRLFNLMRCRFETEPNSVTMIVMLQGCFAPEWLGLGRQLHSYLVKNALIMDISVRNTVWMMYAKANTFADVENFCNEFAVKDIVSSNVLISFYSKNGDIETVVDLFDKMRDQELLTIETLTLVISAFAKNGNLVQGEKLHCFIVKSGYRDNVLRTSLLDFYAKCGELKNSYKLFGEILDKTPVTWGAMMSGFVQNGYFIKAMELFNEMQIAGLETGPVTLTSLVNAFAQLGLLNSGKEIHAHIVRHGLSLHGEENRKLHTSILNMYVKCGYIFFARAYFNKIIMKDVVTWSSMIEGYGSHGRGKEALELFHLMLEEGIMPNEATFLSLLAACSHAGLVSEGLDVISVMKWRFGLEPGTDHYTSVVDLLGRSGKLRDALAVIFKMVYCPDGRIWGALLAASRIHGDRKIGEFAAQRLLELEHDNVGYQTLLSNIQASCGNWSEVEISRRRIHEKDLKKIPGWSSIVVNGTIHAFTSRDRLHKEVEKIYGVLGQLSRNIREADVI